MKWAFLLLVIVAIGIQFVPVARTNPEVTRDVSAPEDVRSILRRACYDCHSNETQWPWYTRVAPVSWWTVSHVNDGRRELNFSRWDRLTTAKQARKARECGEQVASGEMPLPSYLILHPEAKLTEREIERIQEWGGGEKEDE